MVKTNVCFLPPDKGTVQKVIVLPSNNSLHEDLILEELEVFKVSCLFFSPLSFLPFLHSSLFSPKIKGWEEEAEGELLNTKARGQTMKGGIQEMDVICAV